MKNKNLESRLNSILKIANAHYEAGYGMSNSSIGSEREFFVTELLGKIFPNSYRFSSGDIVDIDGNSSGQVDLILEFPHEPSFPSPVGDKRLVLAETAICSFEIKSSISQWGEAIKKTKSINSVKRSLDFFITSTFEDGKVDVTGDDIKEKIPTIVVFYKGPPEISTLKCKFQSLPEAERPSAIFTLDKGFFIYKEVMFEGADGLLGLITLIARLAGVQLVASTMVGNYMS